MKKIEVEIQNSDELQPVFLRMTTIRKYIKERKLQTEDFVYEFLNDHIQDLLNLAIKNVKFAKRKRVRTEHFEFELKPKGNPGV